jgi:hypothetical protein
MKEHFSETSEFLRDLVNYGTNLVIRAYRTSERTLTDIVVCTCVLKHSIVMLDAIEILVSHGALLAAHNPARSLLETLLYLTWILEKDTEKRTRQFWVGHLRREMMWAKRAVPGTPEHGAFKDILSSLSMTKDTAGMTALQTEAARQAAQLEAKLKSSENDPINKEFDRLNKGKYDPHWYSLFGGPSSIGQLAKEAGMEREYKILYSGMSEITHGSAFRKHFKVEDKGLVFEPIRQPEDIKQFLTLVVSLAIKTYSALLTKYRPGELTNFSKKYLAEWKPQIARIKDVKINARMKEI